jgi:protein subunit release factor A
VSRELLFSVTLDDCDVQTFRAGGKGGQNQNKRDTGVRVVHRASGAVGEARDERSQLQNKRNAFIRMVGTGKFRAWIARETNLRGRNIEDEVRESMRPENLRIEGRADGQWRAIG